MDISARVQNLAERAQRQLPNIQTEEATKLALINPFIREVLGYDTTDLTEVVPEYTADVGTKRGEKVDYAILRDGVPRILIEAKKARTRLHEEQPSQLYRYFTTTHSARFGIYTDGVKYLFYSDLDKDNLMDQRPFLVLDLMDLDNTAVEEVSKFVKSEFNPDQIRATASQLKYTRAIKELLADELRDPSEELVKLLMGKVYSGVKTQQRLAEFKGFARRAAQQHIADEIRGKLNAALDEQKPVGEHVETTHTRHIRAKQLLTISEEIAIHWKFKGEEFQAVLQPDGQVRMPDGDTVSPSWACSVVLGRKVNRNGWDVWRFYDEQQGKWFPIGSLRVASS